MNNNKSRLTADEVQRMLMCSYEPDAKIEASECYELRCLDGRVWQLQRIDDEEVLATVNPIAVATCHKLHELIVREMTEPNEEPSYSEAEAADSVRL